VPLRAGPVAAGPPQGANREALELLSSLNEERLRRPGRRMREHVSVFRRSPPFVTGLAMP